MWESYYMCKLVVYCKLAVYTCQCMGLGHSVLGIALGQGSWHLPQPVDLECKDSLCLCVICWFTCVNCQFTDYWLHTGKDCPYIPDHSNRTRQIYKIFTHKYSVLITTDLKLDSRVWAQTSCSKWPSLTSCYQFNSKLMKNWLLQVRAT